MLLYLFCSIHVQCHSLTNFTMIIIRLLCQFFVAAYFQIKFHFTLKLGQLSVKQQSVSLHKEGRSQFIECIRVYKICKASRVVVNYQYFVASSKRITGESNKAWPCCIKEFYDELDSDINEDGGCGLVTLLLVDLATIGGDCDDDDVESDINGKDGGSGLLLLLLVDLAIGGDCEEAGNGFEVGVCLFELL